MVSGLVGAQNTLELGQGEAEDWGTTFSNLHMGREVGRIVPSTVKGHLKMGVYDDACG